MFITLLLFLSGCMLPCYINQNVDKYRYIKITQKEEKHYKNKFYKLHKLATEIVSKRSKGIEVKREEHIFFRKFPSTFKEFICIYGYIYEDMKEGPFNGNAKYKEGIGENYAVFHIEEIFSSLKISKRKFIKKVVMILKDGYWQADGISYLISSCLWNKFEEDKNTYEIFFKILNNFSEYELKRFWMVYSEPAGYKDTNIFRYEKLYPRVVKAYREVLEYIDSFEECK